MAKALALKCRCLIVLTEANAVLEFGKDMGREDFIFVDELTRSEAKELLRHLEVNLSDEEAEFVFQNIGCSPARLIKMSQRLASGTSVADFVKGVLDNAELDLVAFPHQAILKALKEHPEGVSPEYFNNQENKGVDLSSPAAVGVAMKASNAIIYRIEHNQYQLMSTAHRTAIKSYDPILALA